MERSSFKIMTIIVAVFLLAAGVFAIFKFKGSPPVNNPIKNGPAALNSNPSPSANSAVPPSSPVSVPENTPSEAQPAANPAPPSLDSSNVTFAVIGDTKSFKAGNPNGNLEKAVASLSKQKFDFAFVMGDLVQSCDGGSACIKKYNDWKSVMAPILSKTYEIQGNHDRTGGSGADAVWQQEFNLPTNGPSGYSELTYSFDAGNSHFVVLTSEKPRTNIVNDIQRNWLDNDLTVNKKPNVFIFLHEPAFQMSEDKNDALDAKPQERDQFWNILKKHNATAVFNGHLHMIARKQQDGIYQFVIGDTDSTADDVPQKNLTDFGLTGHHYAMVAISGNTVDVKIYSLDGNVENDFSFSR